MITTLGSFSDFLGNLWFAGMIGVAAFGVGFLVGRNGWKFWQFK